MVKIIKGEKKGDIDVDIEKGKDIVINIGDEKKMGVELKKEVIEREKRKIE